MAPDDLPVITLWGPPRQRGEIHGETCRDKIAELYGGWAYGIEKVSGESIDTVAADFAASTRIEDAMRQWTPGLLEELEGMASAANLPFAPFFMFNATDENEWFMKHRGLGLDLPEVRGCSAACVEEGEARYLGQNMDIPGATEGYQVLLRIRHEHSGLESLVVSLTGMLALMGLNNSPLGVVNNSLRQLNSRIDGLPVNVMVRALLEHETMQTACDFIRSAPHASGQNYILASDTGAAMFECSAAGATRVDGPPLHTNHPIASTDVNPDPRFNVNSSSSDTVVRLADLGETLDGGSGSAFDRLAMSLRSHRDPDNPVCRHLTNRRTNFSAASVIYDLSRPPAMHVIPGPPCLHDYRAEEFSLRTRHS